MEALVENPPHDRSVDPLQKAALRALGLGRRCRGHQQAGEEQHVNEKHRTLQRDHTRHQGKLSQGQSLVKLPYSPQ